MKTGIIIALMLLSSVFLMLGLSTPNYPVARMVLDETVIEGNTVFFNVSFYSEKKESLVIEERVNGVRVLEKELELRALQDSVISFNASLSKGENEVRVLAYYPSAEYNGYGSKANPYYVFFKTVV